MIFKSTLDMNKIMNVDILHLKYIFSVYHFTMQKHSLNYIILEEAIQYTMYHFNVW
jgi:hypothetical protein